MKKAKLIVVYPTPSDVVEFERRYASEHVPMAVEKLAGKTSFEATLIKGAAAGETPYHRIAEVYFPSREALVSCLNSPGGKETAAHAVEISTGGKPLFLIAESEEIFF
jgi:uncharacterized protein (TIGR02118 family)